MATYVDDMQGYAIGEDPIEGSGWTNLLAETTNSNGSVISGASPVGDRFWRAATSVSRDGAYRYDTAPIVADQEVLTCTRRSHDNAQLGSAVRFKGIGHSSRTGYAGVARNGVNFDGRIFKWESAASTNHNETAHGLGQVTDLWVWVRTRVDGNRIRVRLWLDGNSEPGTWLIDTTDHTENVDGRPGWARVTGADAVDCDIAYFSAGTLGDDAPSPASTGIAISRTIRSTTVGVLS